MSPDAQEKLLNLLKQFAPDQPFSIEELTRLYLNEKGISWQHFHEVAAQEEIEKYLQEQGFIKEFGQTTLYNITQKVKE